MNFKKEISKAIKDSLASLGVPAVDFSLETPKLSSFGDYATNVALVAGRSLGQKPLDLAEKIQEKLLSLPSLAFIEEIKVAPPGFINFYLKPNFLLKVSEEIISSKEGLVSKTGEGKTVIIDYSSPNIAKPFGVGHLRSTIIGQALYNLYAFLGYKVIGDNHLGDWGTQFGVLIRQVKSKSPEKIEDLTIEDLEKLYVEFHREVVS